MPNPRRVAASLLLLGVCAAAGCGVKTYEARAEQNSKPFFKHQNELNAHLGLRVRHGDARQGQVSLRLPAMLKENKAKPEEGERDPRLPPGFDGTLPGLLAAYRGPVKATRISGGAPATATAYAFLISEAAMPAPDDAAVLEPNFERDVFGAISSGLGYEQTAPPKFARQTVGGEAFAPSVTYQRASLDAEIDGVDMLYDLYVTQQSGGRAAILFVIPKQPVRPDMLKPAVPLSLETVEVKRAASRGGGRTPVQPSGGETPPAGSTAASPDGAGTNAGDAVGETPATEPAAGRSSSGPSF